MNIKYIEIKKDGHCKIIDSRKLDEYELKGYEEVKIEKKKPSKKAKE